MVSLGQPQKQKILEDTGVITSITTDGLVNKNHSQKLRTQKCLRTQNNSILGSAGASDTSSAVQFLASETGTQKRFRNQYKRPKKVHSIDAALPLQQLTTVQRLLTKPIAADIIAYFRERVVTLVTEAQTGSTLKRQILTDLPREHDRAILDSQLVKYMAEEERLRRLLAVNHERLNML